MACRNCVRRSAPRRLMVAAAERARQFCHCCASARREGLRGEGACTRSTGTARAELADTPGCSGRASEICRKRLAQMKLSAKRGASDTMPALADQRVIEQGHHGASGRQGFQHAVQWDPPESLGIETLAFKQAIGR